MKKKLAIGSVALLILAALAVQLSGRPMDEKEAKKGEGGSREKKETVTLTGTVVDMHCYVTHGIRDAAHTACSNACIARGVPAGFLADDGTLYMLFEEKPVSVKDRVAGLADVPVVLKGTISVRNGVKGIQVQSIERVAKTS
jgi:hypothetical protein